MLTCYLMRQKETARFGEGLFFKPSRGNPHQEDEQGESWFSNVTLNLVPGLFTSFLFKLGSCTCCPIMLQRDKLEVSFLSTLFSPFLQVRNLFLIRSLSKWHAMVFVALTSGPTLSVECTIVVSYVSWREMTKKKTRQSKNHDSKLHTHTAHVEKSCTMRVFFCSKNMQEMCKMKDWDYICAFPSKNIFSVFEDCLFPGTWDFLSLWAGTFNQRLTYMNPS